MFWRIAAKKDGIWEWYGPVIIGDEYVTVTMMYFQACEKFGQAHVYLLQSKTARTLIRPDIEHIPGKLSPIKLVQA